MLTLCYLKKAYFLYVYKILAKIIKDTDQYIILFNVTYTLK